MHVAGYNQVNNVFNSNSIDGVINELSTLCMIAQNSKQPTRPSHNSSSLLIKRLKAAKHGNNEQKPASNLGASHQLESATKLTPPNSEAEKHTTTLPNKIDKSSPCDHSTDRTIVSKLEQQLEHSDTHPAIVPCEVSVSQTTDVAVKCEDDTQHSTTSDDGTKITHDTVVKHSMSDRVTVSNKQKDKVTLSPEKSKIRTTTSLHVGDTLYENSQELTSTSSHETKTQDVRTAPSAIPVSDGKYSDYQEAEYDDDVSFDTTDDSNQVFEELFGSSGGEDEYDDTGGDMEIGDGEMEQRRAEEEFRRITAQSTDLPHASVSGNTSKVYRCVSSSTHTEWVYILH